MVIYVTMRSNCWLPCQQIWRIGYYVLLLALRIEPMWVDQGNNINSLSAMSAMRFCEISEAILIDVILSKKLTLKQLSKFFKI